MQNEPHNTIKTSPLPGTGTTETVGEISPEHLATNQPQIPAAAENESIFDQPKIDLSGIIPHPYLTEQMANDDRARALNQLMDKNREPLTTKEKAELRSTNPHRKNTSHVPKVSVLRTLVNKITRKAGTLTSNKDIKTPTEEELARSIHILGQEGAGSYLDHVAIPGKPLHHKRKIISDNNQDFPKHLTDHPMSNFSNILLPIEEKGGEKPKVDFSKINGPRGVNNDHEPIPAFVLSNATGSPRFLAAASIEEAQAKELARAKILAHSHMVLTRDDLIKPNKTVLPEEVHPLFTETKPPESIDEFTLTQPLFRESVPFAETVLPADTKAEQSHITNTYSEFKPTVPVILPQDTNEDSPVNTIEAASTTAVLPDESLSTYPMGIRETGFMGTLPEKFEDTVPGVLPGGKAVGRSHPKMKEGYKISLDKPKRGPWAKVKNKIRKVKKGITHFFDNSTMNKKSGDASIITDNEFENESGVKVSKIEQVAKIEMANNAIRKINKKTEDTRRTLLEQVGGAGKAILNRIENIGDKFNSIKLRYKLGTGLVIAALGATGFPFVIPLLAVTTLYRAAAGAGTYALLHKLLEKNYKAIESRGGKVSFLRKGVMEVSALGVSAFGMYYLTEFIGNHFSGGSGVVTSTPVSAPDIVSPTPVDVSPVAVPSPESVAPHLPNETLTHAVAPSSLHTILPNERLWDVVKNHLLISDTFKDLSTEAKNLEISKYIAYIDQQKILPNVHLIHAGDVIDFSKIDGKVPIDILKHVKPF